MRRIPTLRCWHDLCLPNHARVGPGHRSTVARSHLRGCGRSVRWTKISASRASERARSVRRVLQRLQRGAATRRRDRLDRSCHRSYTVRDDRGYHVQRTTTKHRVELCWAVALVLSAAVVGCTPVSSVPKPAEGENPSTDLTAGVGAAAGDDEAEAAGSQAAGTGGSSSAGQAAEIAGTGAGNDGAAVGGSTAGNGSAGTAGDGPMSNSAGSDGAGSGGTAGAPSSTCGDGKIEGSEICDGNCPTVDKCPAMNACLAPVITGSAGTCDAHCDTDPITICAKGDGCCPSGCKHPEDDDCSKSCGDGVVDPPESCEPTDPTHPCPTSCDDGMASTKDVLTGAAKECSAKCSNVPITMPISGDGYCPAGANANNDRDCSPMCGNKQKETGEECDGDCPTSCPRPGDPCTVAEPQGSGCQVKCVERKLTASRSGIDSCCPPNANATTDSDCAPVCGNGVTEPDEMCDAACPRSCPAPSEECVTSTLEQGGTCNARCVTGTVSASGRTKDGKCCGANGAEDADCPSRCGNGVIEPGEECDDSSTRCVSCKLQATYGYPRCTGEPYTKSTCPQLPGQDVFCTAYQYCGPTCNDMNLSCPLPTSGSAKASCAIICQIPCQNDQGCPGSMRCILPDGYCGYM
jgi:hypothetical protein